MTAHDANDTIARIKKIDDKWHVWAPTINVNIKCPGEATARVTATALNDAYAYGKRVRSAEFRALLEAAAEPDSSA